MTPDPKTQLLEPARDPVEAWRRLVDLGGMEPDGRDSDFVDLVRVALDPQAADFGSALASCPNNETLVRSVFDVVAPFSEMSRDIVNFMRMAGATQGKASVRIALENSVLGLEQFEEFSATLRTGPGVVEILDATIADGFELANALERQSPRVPLASDVGRWLRAFDDGEFRALPPSLDLATVPRELADFASIVATALAALRSVAKTRRQRDAFLADRSYQGDGGSIADPATIARFEHDLLGRLIRLLGEAMADPDRRTFEAASRPILSRIPRRPQLTSGDISALERVLALPVWKKRFELYAVWIATRIAAAVEPERVVVHPDQDGALPFAFRRTLLVTIDSAEGPKRLWAERQEACANPIGKNRTGHVQPDYGLWSGEAGADHCDLIVEVKHYKTPALRTFGAALVDYATAHPHAETVLVNYGRAAGVIEHDRWSHHHVLHRCREIGDLTPYNRAACQSFADLVRDAAAPIPHPDLLLIDVSGSTRDYSGALRTKSVVQSWLRAPEQAHIKRVIAAEGHAVIWDLPRLDAANRLEDPIAAAGNDPLHVAQLLLTDKKRIWIATDSSGVDTFSDASFPHFAHVRHMTGIDLVEVGNG
jgi:hypothetical protein